MPHHTRINRVAPTLAAVTALATAVLGLTLSTRAAGEPAPDGITDGWAGAGLPAAPSGRMLMGAPGGYPVTGIDVSHYQPDVDWKKVADKGARFAYAKATEGTHYYDDQFGKNNSGAKRNGVYFGAYHFARPDRSGGRTQADYFLDRARYTNDGHTLPPMLDMEWPYKSGGKYVADHPCWGKSKSELVKWIRDFTERVRERTGSATMIYTNPNWWNPCTGRSTAFGRHYLFISSYTDKVNGLPAGWDHWTLWQYANHGKLPGDQNVFNGSLAELAALASNPLGPMPKLVVGDWDGNGTMTAGLVTPAGEHWRWRLTNQKGTAPIAAGGADPLLTPDLDFEYGEVEKAPIVGDWDGNGTWTPGTVDSEGKRHDYYLANGFRPGPADIHVGYGDIEDVPLVGDWDGNGTFTPGTADADGKRHDWKFTNSLTDPKTEVKLTVGDAGKTPVVGDWDGNGTYTPGTVDNDGERHDYYLVNSLTATTAEIHLGFGGVYTVPLVGDWDGDKKFTPGAVDASGTTMRWLLLNNLLGGDLPDLAFRYGETGILPDPQPQPSPSPSASPSASPSGSPSPAPLVEPSVPMSPRPMSPAPGGKPGLEQRPVVPDL
ncbi:GH25 family lysozyme [Catellatospora tritici]|uniref:GH25 family lysozyme n=1 Tax=Catellatospora tritici TaxID=2851566 RepID=UPI001C2CD414|nr:GH25 family lysozyme [Catellatospora tritici]MBV1852808.1 hypothetical protein [Catellatospora tritici]